MNPKKLYLFGGLIQMLSGLILLLTGDNKTLGLILMISGGLFVALAAQDDKKK